MVFPFLPCTMNPPAIQSIEALVVEMTDLIIKIIGAATMIWISLVELVRQIKRPDLKEGAT